MLSGMPKGPGEVEGPGSMAVYSTSTSLPPLRRAMKSSKVALTNPTMHPIAEKKGAARTNPIPIRASIPPWAAGRWAQIVLGGWWREGDLTRINHPFLNKFFFTARTEFRTEVTAPNPLSAR